MSDLLDALQQAFAGRYVIERELGRGATASVYLAQDLKHRRRVAIKMLDPALALAVPTERFSREILIASRLNHPHIVSLFDSGVAAGCQYYVMPHMVGETLRDLLERGGRLGVDEALGIAREVADALDYAHGEGIVHRDIKPANILISGGHVWVADFGIAVASEDLRVTGTGASMGTPAYMSPEQASGLPDLDGRTDIYSLGCVLYEMLAGAPPFPGPTVQMVVAQHLTMPARPLRAVRSQVPSSIDRVVARALEKKRDDRYASAQEFRRALESGQPPAFRLKKRRLVALAISLTLAVALAWLGWSLVGDRPFSGTQSDANAPAAASTFDPTHIAVLYFDDLSLDGHLHQIAAGLTHDLISALASVQGLRVISPEGVKPFRNVSVPVDSLARRLQVGTIVSGSVAGVRSRLRMSIRMVEPLSGSQLLSHSVEGSLDDLFALQDELTGEISRGLRQRLGKEIQTRRRRSEAHTVAAWEHVQLAGRLIEDARALERVGQEGPALQLWYQADSTLRRAEALAPRWAHSVLARGWVAYAISLRPPPGADRPTHILGWMRVGLAHAKRALSVAEGDPEALELRGVLALRLGQLVRTVSTDSLIEGAQRDLVAATNARPSLARAWHALADLHLGRGRLEAAAKAARQAWEADAFLDEAPAVLSTLVFATAHLGRSAEAQTWCEQGLARFPEDPRLADCGLMLLGWFARGATAVAEAWRAVDEIERADSLGMHAATWNYRRMLVAMVLARTRMRDSTLAVIGRVRADSARRGPARGITLLAEAYARHLLGQRQEALALIRTAAQADTGLRAYAAATPWFETLHGDSLFEKALGIVPD